MIGIQRNKNTLNLLDKISPKLKNFVGDQTGISGKLNKKVLQIGRARDSMEKS